MESDHKGIPKRITRGRTKAGFMSGAKHDRLETKAKFTSRDKSTPSKIFVLSRPAVQRIKRDIRPTPVAGAATRPRQAAPIKAPSPPRSGGVVKTGEVLPPESGRANRQNEPSPNDEIRGRYPNDHASAAESPRSGRAASPGSGYAAAPALKPIKDAFRPPKGANTSGKPSRPMRDLATLGSDELMTSDEMCRYLNIGPGTARNWRTRGYGPTYVRISSRCIRYQRRVLDEWIAARAVGSTSEGTPDA